MSASNNPRISGLLITVTWLEVVILAWAGLGLLLYPRVIDFLWPWQLAPFNLRYLGALYSAALVAAILQAWSARWSPARVVTPMIFAFTLVVTVYSFVHLDRFDFARVETWVWFVLYIGVCVNAGAHLWAYRRLPAPAGSLLPSRATKVVLQATVMVLGAYGLALLFFPASSSAFWPWGLDDFHAHLYSVTFLTPAVGAWVLLRPSTPADRRTLGLTLLVWGTAPILALLLADLAVSRVRWTAVETAAWLLLFAGISGVGAWLLARAGAGAETASPGRRA